MCPEVYQMLFTRSKSHFEVIWGHFRCYYGRHYLFETHGHMDTWTHGHMDTGTVPENSHLYFILGPNFMLKQSQKVFWVNTRHIFLFKNNRFEKRMKIETQIEKIVKISGTSIKF